MDVLEISKKILHEESTKLKMTILFLRSLHLAVRLQERHSESGVKMNSAGFALTSSRNWMNGLIKLQKPLKALNTQHSSWAQRLVGF